MPELVFKGKEYVYNHHVTVPYRPLEPDPGRSVGAVNLAGNLVVHGDNLHALKSLLPRYAGKVDLVFIDPPCNTGNESWSYDDNVDSPLMQEWLRASPVNVDDMLRHDKWLCMMWPRLALLRELLSMRGSLWMTLDDNESHHARAMLDEIFGEQNFVATCIWHKNFAQYFSEDHDYLLVYARDKETWRPNLLDRTEAMEHRYANPDNDPRGPWKAGDLSARNPYSQGVYSIECPGGRVIAGPPPGRYWVYSKEKLAELDRDGRIWWGESGNNVPAVKRFLAEVRPGKMPQTLWQHREVGHTQDAKKDLLRMWDDAMGEVFVTPKPVPLVERVVRIAARPDSVVLDSFAGSGTTAHAVLKANAEDGGARRFILVECEEYADALTAERVRRAIDGHAFKGTERVELLREKITWTKLRHAQGLVQRAEALRAEHAPPDSRDDLLPASQRRFDEVEIKVEDGELRVEGVRRVSKRREGLGGAFTFCTLGEALDPDGILSGEKLPDYRRLGAWIFHAATGGSLEQGRVREGDFHLGDAGGRLLWMIYRPDPAFLKSPQAALTLSFARELHERYRDRRHLVFAPAKFVANRRLLDLGVEYAPLPLALLVGR